MEYRVAFDTPFIGFTGTPLYKYDQLTRRIFGGYVSRYDCTRSEEARCETVVPW
jgi:type I site-specific restriction-modification system R (restriction) subunit